MTDLYPVKTAVDPVAVAQGEFAADPVPEVAADPAASLDPLAAPAEPGPNDPDDLEDPEPGPDDLEDPEDAEDDEPLDEDAEFDEEPVSYGSRHARQGVQSAPADHPRTRPDPTKA